MCSPYGNEAGCEESGVELGEEEVVVVHTTRGGHLEVVEATQPNFHVAGAGEAELDRAAVFEFFVFETEGGISAEGPLTDEDAGFFGCFVGGDPSETGLDAGMFVLVVAVKVVEIKVEGRRRAVGREPNVLSRESQSRHQQQHY